MWKQIECSNCQNEVWANNDEVFCDKCAERKRLKILVEQQQKEIKQLKKELSSKIDWGFGLLEQVLDLEDRVEELENK